MLLGVLLEIMISWGGWNKQRPRHIKFLSLYLEIKDLSGRNCVGIKPNDALSVAGCSLLLKKERKANADAAVVIIHYFLYREMLVQLLESLEIWNDVMKLVNCVKQWLVYPRTFLKAVCKPGQRVHIFHAACRHPGVYQGRVLKRV